MHCFKSRECATSCFPQKFIFRRILPILILATNSSINKITILLLTRLLDLTLLDVQSILTWYFRDTNNIFLVQVEECWTTNVVSGTSSRSVAWVSTREQELQCSNMKQQQQKIKLSSSSHLFLHIFHRAIGLFKIIWSEWMNEDFRIRQHLCLSYPLFFCSPMINLLLQIVSFHLDMKFRVTPVSESFYPGAVISSVHHYPHYLNCFNMFMHS